MRLETKRLIVRPLRAAEAKLAADLFRREKKYLTPFTPRWPANVTTVSLWRKHLAEFHDLERRQRGIKFFLFLKTDPKRPIGSITVSEVVRGSFQAAYLGYFIGEEHQGKGLTTEAARAVIKFGFEKWNLHRLMANYMPSNQRSGAVLKRLGFTIEGRAKSYLHINGRWADHVLTSLVNRRWKEKRKGVV